MSKMTFDEYYGDLPVSTHRLVKKYNVSPADYSMIVDILGVPTWKEIEEHILAHSEKGYYIFTGSFNV